MTGYQGSINSTKSRVDRINISDFILVSGDIYSQPKLKFEADHIFEVRMINHTGRQENHIKFHFDTLSQELTLLLSPNHIVLDLIEIKYFSKAKDREEKIDQLL